MMTTLIRIVISLAVFTMGALERVSATATATDTQRKSTQRSSNSSAQNRSKKVRQLINATAKGDLSKVLAILHQGVNINDSFEQDDSELSGMTALMVASSHGYSELVAELIKHGADVNLKRYTGEPPMVFGARSGDIKTVKALLRAGADPDARVMSLHVGEITPLTSAINSEAPRRVEVARILIEAGAQINPTGEFLISPLMHSVNDLKMVKLLVANGADVNQRNYRGVTALMTAAHDGTTSVVSYLLEKGADAQARDKEGNTALMYAENPEIIEVLKRKQIETRPQ